MQLKYGSYAFDANAVKLATSADLLWNEGGQPYKVRKRVEADGFLTASGQAANSTAMSALATALARPYQDLYFYHDDGSLSAMALPNATSIGGVRIVAGPNFPDSFGGEFSQFRRFTFAAEAEYPLANTNNLLLSFHERLSFRGGGSRYAVFDALNTLPQRQLVNKFTAYMATQQGEAVGFRGRPTPPDPIWPDALLNTSPDRDIDSPKRRGGLVARYEEWPVTWRYEFKSPTPLVGFPNLWIG